MLCGIFSHGYRPLWRRSFGFPPPPTRPAAGRLRRVWDPLVERATCAWSWLRTLYQVLLLVRFSLLLGVVGGLVLVLNGQAQDVVRALGEEPDRRILWLIVAALASASVAWWSARVMFYFRFRNPASAPTVFPGLKEYLPRVLGASALLLVAIALAQASFSYQGWFAGPGGRLGGLALLFLLLAAGFVYVTTKRRVWLAQWIGGDRPTNLRSLDQLRWQAWLPLAAAAVGGFLLMILFAYRALAWAPEIGTAAVGLLAVVGLIPVGSLLVYWGNRARLPVVTLVLLWVTFSTYVADNHYVRLDADMPSYAPPAPPVVAPAPGPAPDDALRAWLDGLAPAADGRVPVFIVAAEGGGIRAAYWTALVLGELQDRAAASGIDFARHLFAISGVSGGSLGAATFAALVANRSARPKPVEDCPVDQGVDPATLRGRAERVLSHDFLSPTVAVMLFPDLFQQLVPFGFLDDRAVAIEKSFEAAWRACEEGDWLATRFDALWSTPDVRGVPQVFMNSTVVETGQRLIAAPVAIEEPTFSEALDSRTVVGPEILLSTAVHDSARFTYVSPAGTVRRQDSAAPAVAAAGRRRLFRELGRGDRRRDPASRAPGRRRQGSSGGDPGQQRSRDHRSFGSRRAAQDPQPGGGAAQGPLAYARGAGLPGARVPGGDRRRGLPLAVPAVPQTGTECADRRQKSAAAARLGALGAGARGDAQPARRRRRGCRRSDSRPQPGQPEGRAGPAPGPALAG